MEGAVARRYAQALIEVAQEQNLVEKVDTEARVLAELFADRQLRAFFLTPTIPRERKKLALDRALGGKVDPLLLNLCRLLVEKGRMAQLPDILHAFDRLTDVLRGVEEVTVVSAVPLSEQQRQDIVGGLMRFAAYGNLRVKSEVDPTLLGGVLVRLGQQVIDGSSASRLVEMKQRLTAPAWRTA